MFYRCLETEQLFVDPMFPPCESSLYVSKSSPEIKWIRASELVEDPQFFVGGGTRFDINQGELGDCWLLAALANLTLNKRLLYQGKLACTKGQLISKWFWGSSIFSKKRTNEFVFTSMRHVFVHFWKNPWA